MRLCSVEMVADDGGGYWRSRPPACVAVRLADNEGGEGRTSVRRFKMAKKALDAKSYEELVQIKRYCLFVDVIGSSVPEGVVPQ